MTLDSSGNLGLGVTPSAWGQGRAFEISAVGEGLWGNGLGDIWMINGAYFNSDWKYSGTTRATAYRQGAGTTDGSHAWFTAPSGTAGNAISFTQAMTLDASGNLLVGATSALGVIGEKVTIANNNNTVLSIVATNDTTPSLQFRSNSVDRLTIDSSSTFGAYFNVRSNQDIRFGTNNTERARISSDGTFRVKGAGTAGSTDAFQVSGSAPASAMTLDASGRLGLGATSPGTNLHIGTGSSPENLGVTLSRGATTNFYLAHDGTKTFIAGIDPTNDGPKIGSLNSYPFLFVTGNSERARITSGGDLLVACTSFPSGSSAGFGFNASQYAYFSRSSGESLNLDRFTTEGKTQVLRYAGTEVGNISVTASATAYNTSSDYRLKDKPQPLTGSGAFIDSLKPKTWAWKSDGSKGVGFIAHEVQEVSPGSVVGEKDAVDAEGNPVYQAMEYGSAEFISNIIAELQSLRARVAQLEAK
jgi:hypothetical protein